MKTKEDKPDTRTQRQKFIDAAHEHGADGPETEDTLKTVLGKIAVMPATKGTSKTSPPKKIKVYVKK